jgi:hypothetical protein
MLDDDLASVKARDERDSMTLGMADGRPLRVPVYGTSLLISRGSAGEKSHITANVMERLTEAGYQFLAFDPRGDYQSIEGAVLVGDRKRAPLIDEVLKTLTTSGQSLVVNLLGVSPQKRPVFFESLVPRLREMRVRTGRPHWVILDEVDHLMPVLQRAIEEGPIRGLTGAVLIAMEPNQLPPNVLCSIDMIVAVGDRQEETIRAFCTSCDQQCPPFSAIEPQRGRALLWSRKRGGVPVSLQLETAG